AVLLYRADLAERAPEALRAVLWLEGRLSEDTMIRLNGEADGGTREATVAAKYLTEQLGEEVHPDTDTLAARLLRSTGEHLRLVAISLGLAIVTAVPLGVLAARFPWLGQVVLILVGVVQTVPSVALLAILIVLLKMIGPVPAIVALYLYSLLPIVRNTYTGLS